MPSSNASRCAIILVIRALRRPELHLFVARPIVHLHHLEAHDNPAHQICAFTFFKPSMNNPNFFSDLQAKINQAIEASPAKDIEKNVKAMLNQGFSKLDLVTREEFDIQAQVLAKTRAKLEALEARVAALEARPKKS
jgi:ubiquinone biosynthesis accessory factor UbiK